LALQRPAGRGFSTVLYMTRRLSGIAETYQGIKSPDCSFAFG